jgi:hypothetical protein
MAMKAKKYAVLLVLAAAPLVWITLHAQQQTPTLTALDYAEIGQLANRYAHAIDTCSNNGYDYADLYTADGTFTDYVTDEGYVKKGLVRAKGREEIARASGGGSAGCKNVGWNGWSHLTLNHVITPAPGGARGRSYLVTIGAKGPNSVERFGGYEDFYVKTPQGWRIQSRTHVRNRAWHNPLLQSPDLN